MRRAVWRPRGSGPEPADLSRRAPLARHHPDAAAAGRVIRETGAVRRPRGLDVVLPVVCQRQLVAARGHVAQEDLEPTAAVARVGQHPTVGRPGGEGVERRRRRHLRPSGCRHRRECLPIRRPATATPGRRPAVPRRTGQRPRTDGPSAPPGPSRVAMSFRKGEALAAPPATVEPDARRRSAPRCRPHADRPSGLGHTWDARGR